jgi:hypothetical protein
MISVISATNNVYTLTLTAQRAEREAGRAVTFIID